MSIGRSDFCQGVVYGVLQHPGLSRESGGAVIAVVAAHHSAGSSHVAKLLTESLGGDELASFIVLDGRNLSSVHDAEVETAEPDRHIPRGSSGKRRSWRSSREFRSQYLNSIRKSYPYVLIDCPSLKESMEALSLVSLVDGVILVIEANKTTKNQIDLLERTIENAGGNVLGHILNKRTYAVPGWAHRIIESWEG